MILWKISLNIHLQVIDSYGFCTPVTQRQVLIKINFQAPKTIQTNYWQPPDCGLIIR